MTCKKSPDGRTIPRRRRQWSSSSVWIFLSLTDEHRLPRSRLRLLGACCDVIRLRPPLRPLPVDDEHNGEHCDHAHRAPGHAHDQLQLRIVEACSFGRCAEAVADAGAVCVFCGNKIQQKLQRCRVLVQLYLFWLVCTFKLHNVGWRFFDIRRRLMKETSIFSYRRRITPDLRTYPARTWTPSKLSLLLLSLLSSSLSSMTMSIT